MWSRPTGARPSAECGAFGRCCMELAAPGSCAASTWRASWLQATRPASALLASCLFATTHSTPVSPASTTSSMCRSSGAWNFMSVGGGLTCVILDQPDLQFKAKSVKRPHVRRLASAPLKLVALTLAGTPELAWLFGRRATPLQVSGYADADWGGDAEVPTAPWHPSAAWRAPLGDVFGNINEARPESTSEAEVVALVARANCRGRHPCPLRHALARLRADIKVF